MPEPAQTDWHRFRSKNMPFVNNSKGAPPAYNPNTNMAQRQNAINSSNVNNSKGAPPAYNPNTNMAQKQNAINSSKENIKERSSTFEKFRNRIYNIFNKKITYTENAKIAGEFLKTYESKIALPMESGSSFEAHCSRAFQESGGSKLSISSKRIVEDIAAFFYRDNKDSADVKAIIFPILADSKFALKPVTNQKSDLEDDGLVFGSQGDRYVNKGQSNGVSHNYSDLYSPPINTPIYVGDDNDIGGSSAEDVVRATDNTIGLNPVVTEAGNDVVEGFSSGGFFSSIGSALAPVGRVLGSVFVGGYENVLTPIGHGLSAVGNGILSIFRSAPKAD
jgi:hypothetical protein